MVTLASTMAINTITNHRFLLFNLDLSTLILNYLLLDTSHNNIILNSKSNIPSDAIDLDSE